MVALILVAAGRASVPHFSRRVRRTIAPPWRPLFISLCLLLVAARCCCFLAGVYCRPLPLFGGRVLRAVTAFWRSRVARRCHFGGRVWPAIARLHRPHLARLCFSPAAQGRLVRPLWRPRLARLCPLWRPGLARLCPLSVAAAGASVPIVGWRVWRAVATTAGASAPPSQPLLACLFPLFVAVCGAPFAAYWLARLARRCRSFVAECGAPLPLFGGLVTRTVAAFGGHGLPVVAPPYRPRAVRFCSCPAAAAVQSSARPSLPRLACLNPLLVVVCGAPSLLS